VLVDIDNILEEWLTSDCWHRHIGVRNRGGLFDTEERRERKEGERESTCWYITISIFWVSKSPTPTYIAQVRLTEALR
jgi:hypothetical protein